MGPGAYLPVTESTQRDLLRRGYSRRAFGRIAALLGGSVPLFHEAVFAQKSYIGEAPSGAVLLNANENPLGPCPEAIAAMTVAMKNGGRYQFGEVMRLRDAMASSCGLKSDSVRIYAGSSDPLHRTVLAFCSPSRPVVVGDPGYEACERAAEFIGASCAKVPLTKDYAHDVKAMRGAVPNAGVYYICNPNNPTGTLTRRADIEWLLKNKPQGSILLIDEAYLHFSDEKPCTDLVAGGEDVIVLRTFSKLYGMAGLRAGAALGRPDLLSKLDGYATGFLTVTGMSGANASLASPNLVAQRRALTRDTRQNITAWLTDRGWTVVPSTSNKFMLDVKRPGREMFQALAAQNVFVGRTWPVWPTYVRVTVGTPEEMEKFKAAFTKVTA